MTARVFVPLVGANGEAARLFEAIADATPPPPHPARLIPQISELFDFGLYTVGQVAREAVIRFVDARRAKLWLSPRNGAETPWHLRISDTQVGRLSEENSRSAGLALVVAALCQVFGRDPGVVFATGEILLPSAPHALTASVGAVGGVHAKLALIGDYLAQHRKPLQGKRIFIALPREGLDGRSLALSESGTLSRLQSEAERIGATLETVFLDSLDDLEKPLGPFQLPERITPRRAILGLVSALTLAAVAGAAHLAAGAPVTLAFTPSVAAESGADGVEPRRALYDSARDKIVPQPLCFDAQREPLVVGGETLVFKVRAHDDWPWIALWRPAHLFVVSVSRAADPIVLDAARFKSVHGADVTGGDGFAVAIPIDPIEDEIRLFVVATRDPQMDATRLQNELREALKGLSGAAVFTTTTSFLADRLGNILDYEFKVTNDAKACPA